MSFYKEYSIANNETIQSIAFKYLGDVDKWRSIVALNDLQYPYIVKTNKERLSNPEHLRAVGDLIKLPITQNLDDLTYADINSFTQSKVYDMALGMDISLGVATTDYLHEGTGELMANSSNDLATVVGNYNLKQSIMLRILTRKGTLLRHPSYGSLLEDYIGTSIDAKTLSNILVELKRVIATDARVSSIKINNASISQDTMTIQVSVTPISGEDAFSIFLYKADNGQLLIN